MINEMEIDKKCWPLFSQHFKIVAGRPAPQVRKVADITGIKYWRVKESSRRWRAALDKDKSTCEPEEKKEENTAIKTPDIEEQPQMSETDILREQNKDKIIRDLSRKKTLYELIGEEIISAVEALPPPDCEPANLTTKNHEPEEICMMWSDSHIGSYVDQQESGGLGSYNTDIFLERLEFLKESLKNILQIHLENTPCPAFNLFLLGDIVDGANIFPGQQRQSDTHAIDQSIFAVQKIAEFVRWLTTCYPWEVNVYCVVGNHGRVGKKSEESPLNNFDYAVYRILEEFMSLNERVNINACRSWWQVVERCGWKFYCTHGDDTRAWMGIPFYGLERTNHRVTQMLGNAGVQFDYLLSGHFHQCATVSDGRIRLNGSWVGGSEFSIKQLKMNAEPAQSLFALHPKYGITWSRVIYLRDPEQKPELEIVR